MKNKPNRLKMMIQLLLVLLIIPLSPMLIAWRWNWWEDWVVAIVFIAGFVISRVLAKRKHPDILAERSDSFSRKDAKPWDKFLAPAMAFGGTIILIISGLDEQFAWSPSPFSFSVKIASIILLILAYLFSSWALVENAYFSGIVRLQKDRGHSVCDSGPYRYLRHPGYAGTLLSYLCMPLILDSAWAFIVTGLLFIVTIARTALEDQTLQNELPGYRAYAERVKHRLLPGIW